jgi:serine/threonine protein kinase
MIKIQLPKGEWFYDPEKPLGNPGGFGAVFQGHSDQLGTIAVKKLHITAEEAGHREIRVANELMHRQLAHVIPIIDAGIDAETGGYFFVMPCADHSLQDEINRRGKISEIEAIDIISQIANGLLEVSQIVHRDLKPGNILFHENKWKIADFGIARFVEESTSLNTLKEFLSPQYASPEQWKQEKVTAKTDIYSLGCIAYALISGKPPFSGASFEELRERHLHSEPPVLECSPVTKSLVLLMLRKIPESRPSPERVKNRLIEIGQSFDQPSKGPGFDGLAIAGAKAAEEASKQESLQIATEQQKIKRQELARFASKSLDKVIEALFEVINKFAPTAKIYRQTNPYVWLGSAMLKIEQPFKGEALDSAFFEKSTWDVIIIANMTVEQQNPKYIWGANLFYADPNRSGEFRWYEVMFMAYPLSRNRPMYEPFCVDVMNYSDAARAIGGQGIGGLQLAAKPVPIDDEHLDSFCNRWAELLAKAYSGELSHPRSLPLS